MLGNRQGQWLAFFLRRGLFDHATNPDAAATANVLARAQPSRLAVRVTQQLVSAECWLVTLRATSQHCAPLNRRGALLCKHTAAASRHGRVRAHSLCVDSHSLRS
jgi:hypothetical protein